MKPLAERLEPLFPDDFAQCRRESLATSCSEVALCVLLVVDESGSQRARVCTAICVRSDGGLFGLEKLLSRGITLDQRGWERGQTLIYSYRERRCKKKTGKMRGRIQPPWKLVSGNEWFGDHVRVRPQPVPRRCECNKE
eukprot:3043611-Prymnesium_polylepis.1